MSGSLLLGLVVSFFMLFALTFGCVSTKSRLYLLNFSRELIESIVKLFDHCLVIRLFDFSRGSHWHVRVDVLSWN